jgi:hypothetical protein
VVLVAKRIGAAIVIAFTLILLWAIMTGKPGNAQATPDSRPRGRVIVVHPNGTEVVVEEGPLEPVEVEVEDA